MYILLKILRTDFINLQEQWLTYDVLATGTCKRLRPQRCVVLERLQEVIF